MQYKRKATLYRWLALWRNHRLLASSCLVMLAVLVAIPIAIFARVRFPTTLSGSQVSQPGKAGNVTRLVNNWTVTPAGTQHLLGDLPVNAALAPDGEALLVVNSGAGIQSVQVVATKTGEVMQTIPYYVPHTAFFGTAYSHNGKNAYVAGGGEDVVHTFTVEANEHITADDDIAIGTQRENPFPMGLSISADDRLLYVANNLANDVAVVDIQNEVVVSTIKVGSYPYTTLLSSDGRTLYVANWGDATVSSIDTQTGRVTATIGVGQHPAAMALSPHSERLYVTDANSDAVSVVDTAEHKEVQRISISPAKGAPLSSSPQGIALSHDGETMYVVDGGNNEVVVIDVHTGTVRGRIPTAWYPTSVAVNPADTTLYVTNGKGYGAGPNAHGLYPDPTRKNASAVNPRSGYNDHYCNCTFNDYSGSQIVGTLSTIPIPGAGQLRLYTRKVAINNREQNVSLTERAPGNPIPLPDGTTSPLKHIIYIIKENRTYDQVFGDEAAGDGDSQLTLFPKENTPNLHALAERFGLLDNFYADAEVSADGHNWTDSANASDYNEKMWPQNYGPRRGRNRPYDFEGDSAINLSPGGYLWDSAADARISYRDYGEFYEAAPVVSPLTKARMMPESQADSCSGPVAHAYTGVTIPAGQVLCFPPMVVNTQVNPHLADHFDPRFRTFDLNYRERDRVAEWQREFQQFSARNDLPQLEILRLPNDHTQGTVPGKPTAQAYVAENDAGVGAVIDTLSHSKYWSSTAVFVTEDDAQNGPDHVDAHRTESLIISPYTSHTQVTVDYTLYDTAAMIRTMELTLHLKPLSQYDANAEPMWRLFTSKPDLRPYSALSEHFQPTQLNASDFYGAQTSAAMDFSVEDRVPMDQLNQILWHAIKGVHKPYPEIHTGERLPGKATADNDG